MVKKISILGATGSIGCQTLDVVQQHSDEFEIVALTASENVEKLIAQARQFKPRYVAVRNDTHYTELKNALAGLRIEIMAGEEGIIAAASIPCDLSMAAITGAAGLKPIWAAVQSGANIALANKEALVCAGSLLLDLLAKHKTKLLPVDSEHNAIFQVLQEKDRAVVDRFILTASGGPFRDHSINDLVNVSVADALAHPTWQMGHKISIDSATMMNKGLELIEACHLFAADEKDIDVVIHPQSIVHSMVTYQDGSTLAQLGASDMRVPISYCLGWPNRLPSDVKKIDWRQPLNLSFMPPDPRKFRALDLARQVWRSSQAACVVLNAANEIAVGAFLAGRIPFLTIIQTVEKMLESVPNTGLSTVNDVLELDRLTRALTSKQILERA